MTDAPGRTLELLKRLVSCPSVTPLSAGAIDLAQEYLVAAGFSCERLPCDEVDNLWATHGSGDPSIIFCGHVDVVPPGDIERWRHDPFVPSEEDGKLYGRGTTDMKGGVAAMLCAGSDFVASHPKHTGTVGILLTSDEEGPAVAGTHYVVKTLAKRGVHFTYGLVGEPSSTEYFGDTLRVGRRGSLSGTIRIAGQQGHVAYPSRHRNPIPVLATIISRLVARRFEPPASTVEATTLQVVNLHADAGASNVVPGVATAQINFRHTAQDSPAQLRAWVEEVCAQGGLQWNCVWQTSAQPYFTSATGKLGQVVTSAALAINGFAPTPSVGGGTSDGRFLVELCDEVVEFGSLGRTMHQVDEYIVIEELDPLVKIYCKVLEQLLGCSVTAG